MEMQSQRSPAAAHPFSRSCQVMYLVIKSRPALYLILFGTLNVVSNFLRGCALERREKKAWMLAGYAIYARRKVFLLKTRLGFRTIFFHSYVTRSENNTTHYLAISKTWCDFYQKRTIVSIGVKLGWMRERADKYKRETSARVIACFSIGNQPVVIR